MGRAIGIDLGTTRSCGAYIDEDGAPRICTDPETGEALIPSVVLYEDGNVLVGSIAEDSRAAYFEEVVDCVKRYMGIANWISGSASGDHTAEEASSEILKEVIRVARACVKEEVNRAVITVPAYFFDRERKATSKAAELANLEVLQLIPEPTAAAIAYAAENSHTATGKQTIGVYDLGGGTFDVTIMELENDACKMLATGGNHRLGGKDFDDRILNYVAELFFDKHGMDPRENLAFVTGLRSRVERAKIMLSKKMEEIVVVQMDGKVLEVKLTRDKFEELTGDLLMLTDVALNDTLGEAKKTAKELDYILMVGGSTRMPMVAKMLEEKGFEVRSSKAPDHSVALGAALMAARYTKDDPGLYKPSVRHYLDDLKISDCVPHSLGTIALDGDQVINAIIIEKGYPVEKEKFRSDFTTTTDNQKSVDVHVVQGEDKDLVNCVPVATYELTDIPTMSAGEPKIKVTFFYDASSLVQVTGMELQTKTTLTCVQKPLVDLVDIIDSPRPHHSAPQTIVMLLDTSYSMANSMSDLKNACLAFVSEVNLQRTEIGIVTFGSKVEVIHKPTHDRAVLERTVKNLPLGGTTPMGAAIAKGTDLLDKVSPEHSRVLVLFTDGMPTDSGSEGNSDHAKNKGIQIACQGLGNANKTFLDQISTNGFDAKVAQSGQELVSNFGNLARLIANPSK